MTPPTSLAAGSPSAALLGGALTPPTEGWQLDPQMVRANEENRLRVQVKHPTESTDHRLGLPDDLLDQALRRLTFVAAMMGSLMAVSVTGNTLYYLLADAIPLPAISVVARVLSVVAAAAVIYVVRYTNLDRQRKIDIGLAFEVIAAAGVAFTEVIMLQELGYPLGVVSTVSLWIVVFQLIVPTSPVRALVAAVLSAATLPCCLVVVEQAGYPAVGSELAFGLYKTTFGAALVAWLASRTMYRMGTAVNRARRTGSYRLEEELGTGGMGQVWRGSHAMLKRPAAIKLIRPERMQGADEGTRRIVFQRFEREAQTTAGFKSVHTVTLFDFGTTADGSFYYVMELLDGMDLETLVRRYGALKPERVVFVLKQVCHSLLEAHQANMVHRDVKPANIFLCRLGPDFDFVKVLDFGLVKDVAPLNRDAKLTMDGVTTGTPAFMAPEVALGKAAVDASTDVYMIGCVAYWLLTGELVFTGDSPVNLIAQHVRDAPVPVGQRAELVVPPALDRLVMACLHKEPGDRPRDAAELLVRLQGLELDGCQLWSNDRAKQWWDSHQPGATLPM